MRRLSECIKLVEDKTEQLYLRHKKKFVRYGLLTLVVWYGYGMLVRWLTVLIHHTDQPLFTWNPVQNMSAVFSKFGLFLTVALVGGYLLFSKKGFRLLSGYKTVQDKERGIEILPEGTHGTSGWMDKQELKNTLTTGSLDSLSETLFGKLDNGEYVGMKDLQGMSRNVLVYGAPGTGKSRGFVMPFAMQAARRGESLIMVDPKAEFYEMYSEFFREQGYTVCAYNLLDLFASDGWNCVMDTAQDIDLVQSVAEVIIKNTSSETDKDDFWAKAEKNLLMALLHYVQTMTYPGTDQLLPPEERSLGTIYKILSTTSVQELDARFRSLPADHPALPPYGIFRQAHKQIWGNIVIGLGNRLNVFQNKLVDDITKHNEIDLTLPGRQKCAYFCIISDQDSSLEFLSSLFFSLLFVKLFDFARSQPNRRLPVCVNVLMDEFCNVHLLESKKVFSVARSRNINIQAVVQSVAQLSNRYPHNEWQEITGNCDYQLFLGCNDAMTAQMISDACGSVTVRVNNSAAMTTTTFGSVIPRQRMRNNSRQSTGRPLMMPDEVRRLPKEKALLLVRGAKPLMLNKITPEEHPYFEKLKYCKAIDYLPAWKKQQEIKKPVPKKPVAEHQMQFDEMVAEEQPVKEIPAPPSLNSIGIVDCLSLDMIPSTKAERKTKND